MNARASFLSSNSPVIIGILRGYAPEIVEQIAKAWFRADYSFLEITLNSPSALEIISHLEKTSGLTIGAGTVCNTSDLEKALAAGAKFIVCPILDEEVVKECVRQNVPVFPGAFTPTEIYRAWALGATMVKVFPAGMLGPSYIREVLAPLNQIALLPTGGVTPSNIREFLQAGARGFGMGSHLFPQSFITGQNWEDLYLHLKNFKDSL
ncbi:MAG: bifunctional 4-hydroxy-2-oxoglutarate aldolase/2-dehydro-3-deoxy-phosphogluconate aldolase [Bacteroidia bacterium]|nr:bifunctional 4-hydroxy-2-oxoglutarate aldolase/2-dehydro-3-deoxy-phosphogluconate aldolase [Bacteroidia bacterium]